MYRYDEFDRTLVTERVAQFRGQVARRVAGQLTEDEFRPLRLMNGLYLQLHAYMLRVAVPYGTLSARQMRQLAYVARRWDKGYGHFTTRQNIQYNWPRLEDVPDILDALAEVEMHAIQTSGNCIRNVTSDQYAGAIADEIEDPRPVSELIRQWSTFHPEFSYLPRKFKIAVTGSPRDRAAIAVHDIGIEIVRNAEGETGYRVLVGGGQGRTPMLAIEVSSFVPKAELLSYLEAVMRVYNRQGRRDNLFKSRIKILVHETGHDRFREMVAEEYAALRTDTPVEVPAAELARIEAYFAPPPFETLPAETPTADALAARDEAFAAWRRHNVKPHKMPGYAIVDISLKPIGGVPGDATAEQMDLVADLAERFSFAEVRVTHEQNLVLPHVRAADLPELWRHLRAAGLATPNMGLVSDIIACPGLDYCNLANA
ncbi:MAG: nitrite/sulfite reductase, partial [Alphaproteobacteria bacterium]|nr:nitrite/sulfite reductase [Alphaproteobacteria bacterium]